MVQFIISADDYAISPAVSDAITELLTTRRLDATACMTASPYWPAMAKHLHTDAIAADIGLHLTMTQFPPLTDMLGTGDHRNGLSYKTLLTHVALGKLNARKVRDEIAAQLDAFEDEMNRPPDFVDGHHHVHLLPTVRTMLCRELSARYATKRLYVRLCGPTNPLRTETLKAKSLAFLSGGLRRLSNECGLSTNDDFRGAYDLAEQDYAGLFKRFVDKPHDGRTIVMCHPGMVDDALAQVDTLTAQRETEYRFFASGAHDEILQELNVRRGRFYDTAS